MTLIAIRRMRPIWARSCCQWSLTDFPTSCVRWVCRFLHSIPRCVHRGESARVYRLSAVCVYTQGASFCLVVVDRFLTQTCSSPLRCATAVRSPPRPITHCSYSARRHTFLPPSTNPQHAREDHPLHPLCCRHRHARLLHFSWNVSTSSISITPPVDPNLSSLAPQKHRRAVRSGLRG